jgi:D-alanyl-D-alanine dipeptidase
MTKSKNQYLATLIFGIVLFFACSDKQKNVNKIENPHILQDSVVEIPIKKSTDLSQLTDSSFIKTQDLSNDFVYDMRYATTNNFLKEKVYDCDNCWLRVKVAKALLKANQALMKKGYQIKFFDCFRPRAVQYKMWEILPDGRYVANPERGSIHNRGAAVDISLVDIESKQPLNMGTDFDHFGKEAHHDFTELDSVIIANRKLLKKVMEQFGFSSIRTEWWHYNFAGTSYSISDQVLCDE